MKNFKSVALIEVLLIVMIGLFSLDFRPKNYNEFNGICAETWPRDPKQYQICMQPYYREINTDKYAIFVTAGLFFLCPVYYFLKKKQN